MMYLSVQSYGGLQGIVSYLKGSIVIQDIQRCQIIPSYIVLLHCHVIFHILLYVVLDNMVLFDTDTKFSKLALILDTIYLIPGTSE